MQLPKICYSQKVVDIERGRRLNKIHQISRFLQTLVAAALPALIYCIIRTEHMNLIQAKHSVLITLNGDARS